MCYTACFSYDVNIDKMFLHLSLLYITTVYVYLCTDILVTFRTLGTHYVYFICETQLEVSS